MLGREGERRRLRALLDAARAGQAGAVVVRGEAGIGKTALLDELVGEAGDCTLLRACPVEADAELSFATLADLCRPVGDLVDELPATSAAVLAAALSFGPADSVDRFAAGAAVLGLLAAAAERCPVLAVVDDAHWADRASLDALAFAGRRLGAARVLLVVTARPGTRADELAGFEVMDVGGLDPLAAESLLAASSPVPLDPAVSLQLLGAARGSPLALVELPAALDEGQLRGVRPLPRPLPVGPALERAYGARVAALPEPTRRALVVAAASTTERAVPVLEALRAQGLDLAALEPAEADGLVELGEGGIHFRHPLMRAAAYAVASPADRRAAHASLAAAHAADDELARRAWHLAAAAAGPDEDAAAALVEAAALARATGGLAAAATALARAARLSPRTADRRARLLDAAETALLAGEAEAARALLGELEDDGLDPLVGAAADHVLGRLLASAGDFDEAVDVLDRAARTAEAVAPTKAAAMLLDAIAPAVQAGRYADALGAATRAAELAGSGDDRLRRTAEIARKAAAVLSGERSEGADLVAGVEELLTSGGDLQEITPLLAQIALVLIWVDEYDKGAQLLAELTAAARRTSAIGVLPVALHAEAEMAFMRLRFTDAWALLTEALSLAEHTGRQAVRAEGRMLLAWLQGLAGRDAEAEATARQVLADARERSGLLTARALHGLGVLSLFRGDAGGAVPLLEEVAGLAASVASPNPTPAVWEPDLVEAYLRAGRTAEARSLCEDFAARVTGSPHSRSVGLALRSRALLAAEDEMDGVFEEALRHDGGSGLYRSRTNICWAWRLGRAGRIDEATERLRTAVEEAEAIGAAAMVEWARTELAQLGSTAPAAPAALASVLTPDEYRVTRSVAGGATAAGTAAALFLSPRTVEALLESACRRAGVDSVAELTARLEPASAVEPAGAEVVVLGRFEVRRDGERCTPPPGMAAKAVKVLAVRGGRLHVDELAEELWPDAGPDVGRTRLRNVLTRLRRSSGELVVREGDLVSLAPDVVVDAVAFEAAARAALGPPADLDGARAALGLTGGTLLPDSLYEPWAASPRERLRVLQLSLLDLVAEGAAAEGRLDEAIGAIERAVELEPLDEDRHLRAARLFLDQGRRGAAASMLRRARRVTEELGLPPSPVVAELEARIAG